MGMCYHRLKNAAKRRGIGFDLTLDDFRQFAQTTGYAYKRGRTVTGYHLDRIDATGPYARWNIQALPAPENCAKGATTDKAQHYAVLVRHYDENQKRMLFWFEHRNEGPDLTCNCTTCRKARQKQGIDPEPVPF